MPDKCYNHITNMEHIEYEERVLISESDYKKVIEDVKREGKKLRHLNIENSYLDNQDFEIYKAKRMLRIRTINGRDKELTLKVKLSNGSTLEINETIESHPRIDKELNKGFSNYQEIARLKTERYEVEFDDYLLVIDKNEYSGTIDYDLEIESDSQAKAKKIIEFYCKKYDFIFDPHYKNKSHRAVDKALETIKK